MENFPGRQSSPPSLNVCPLTPPLPVHHGCATVTSAWPACPTWPTSPASRWRAGAKSAGAGGVQFLSTCLDMRSL